VCKPRGFLAEQVERLKGLVVEQGAIAAERRSDGIVHRCESVGVATRLGGAGREDFARRRFSPGSGISAATPE
jgi:hypothetical protein